MKLAALSNFVLIEKTNNFNKEDNLNIIIPEMNEEKNYGILYSVGPLCEQKDGLTIGSKLYFNPFGSAELKFEDKVFYIVKDTDLMAVITDEESDDEK